MEAVPESFICPISQEIMRDPYIDPEGNSYEKQKIMDWLSRNPVSPITRRPMVQTGLIPNRSLRTLIQEFLDRNPSLRTDEAKDEFSSSTAGALKRKPLILYAIIDTSGSMGESCTEVSSGKEDDGFSRLDLVKHTLNTIITSLSAEDRICIIKFSNTAEMVADLTFLTETNKISLMDRVQRLLPDASTNLWDGLRVAFDQMTTLSADDVESANIAAFLLTDGRPNIHPPRPIVETVDNYIRKRVTNGVKPIIHTFGYGYDIDSDMLYSISKQCHGFFGFIPDSSMVGTVFINSLSNCLVGRDPTLHSRVVDDATYKFVEVVSRFQRVTTGESAMIDGIDSFIAAIKDEINRQLALSEADKDVRGLSFLQGLLLDCEDNEDPNLGQVFKACSTTYYKKWGKHYLYSVMSAFENKVCINFKDKAMQRFKSEQFLVEQERIEDVFLGIAPPKPSYGNSYSSSYGYRSLGPTTASSTVRTPNMSQYVDASGGCFTGASLVYASGPFDDTVAPTPVEQLVAGTQVLSHMGLTEVECVVKLRYVGPIYALNCLGLTAYHPVLLPGQKEGMFPSQCPDAHLVTDAFDGYVFDVVLRNRAIIAAPSGCSCIDAVVVCDALLTDCCMYAATFGHTVTLPKFKHDYFGSERVVADLQKHASYGSGLIVLERYQFLRDDASRDFQVCGLHFPLLSEDHHHEAAAASHPMSQPRCVKPVY